MKDTGMTREKWLFENGFEDAHCCDFCRFFHDGGEELLQDDEYFCEENNKDKDEETRKAFCRVMRDDGVEDYYLEGNFSSMEGCNVWLRA
ncbi:MAG: hypothetical protein LBF77_03695 [Spirochaetaceae bacterium]|jgi:hypothetical protein|nr:hypothetical protein [Spirochaetaceae bacterium]